MDPPKGLIMTPSGHNAEQADILGAMRELGFTGFIVLHPAILAAP
jgi:hypothetical protein